MSLHPLIKWGIVMITLMSLLTGCEAATPTPILIAPDISTPIPPSAPQVIVQRPAVKSTATKSASFAGNQAPAPTAEGTPSAEPSPTATAANPLDRPFLMKIDRISVVTGRGLLLQGRVADGTLQANGSVEILSAQNKAISPTVLAVLIANTMRDQVKVGDYAGILVGGIQLTDVSPGMLLAATGKYKNYQAALEQAQ